MPGNKQQATTSEKRLPMELRMLALDLPAKTDRDQAKQRRRFEPESDSESSGHTSLESSDHTEDPGNRSRARNNNNVASVIGAEVTPAPSNDNDGTSDDESLIEIGANRRESMAGTADLANENNNINPKVPFQSPPPPKGNGNRSFEAIEPTNLLLPFDVMKSTFEKVMICPNICCPTKNPNHECHNKPTLTTENYQCGFASEFCVTCRLCQWGHCISPQADLGKGDSPNASPSKKRKKSGKECEAFHEYEINYAMGICMQKLGKGFSHLAMIMAFLGMCNGIGSTHKWKVIMNRIGLAEWEASEEVIEENRKMERDLVEANADDNPLKWLESEEGADADEDATNRKRDELLCKLEGKVGIIMAGDEGWQKRKIGKNGGDSNTGHNFGLGGETKLVINSESSSKTCRVCDLAEKLGKPMRAHRCPRNFDKTKSSKSMEGHSVAQHCVSIAKSAHGICACGIVADDDSSTRVNCKHSYFEKLKAAHPEYVSTDANGNEVISMSNKRKHPEIWPIREIPKDWMPAGDGKYCRTKKEGGHHKKATPPDLKKDYGLLPLDAPEPTKEYADHPHRARTLGNRLHSMRAPKAETKTNAGLDGGECENAKRNFGYFLSKNQHYSKERFTTEATCVVLHLWNDHSLCDVEWCTALQAEQETNPAKKRKIDDPRKCREATTSSGKALKDRVYNGTVDILTGEKMVQAWHKHNTQKCETMQRQMMAMCPKETHYGGSMQFHDRVRLLVVLDSLGEYRGIGRLHHNLGLPPLKKTLGLWAASKDTENKRKADYRQLPSTKKRRAENKIKKMKESMRKNMRAEKDGVTHGSGIAVTNEHSSGAGAIPSGKSGCSGGEENICREL